MSGYTMNNETLLFTADLTHALFSAFANAGELDYAIMVNGILEKLEAEIRLRGGRHMLVSEKAVYPTFCPRFKPKGEEEKKQ